LNFEETPSLRRKLINAKWQQDVWESAVTQTTQETGIADLPE
jgi:hypothetical protein